MTDCTSLLDWLIEPSQTTPRVSQQFQLWPNFGNQPSNANSFQLVSFFSCSLPPPIFERPSALNFRSLKKLNRVSVEFNRFISFHGIVALSLGVLPQFLSSDDSLLINRSLYILINWLSKRLNRLSGQLQWIEIRSDCRWWIKLSELMLLAVYIVL